MTSRTSLRVSLKILKLLGFGLATWFLAVPQLPLVWRALGALAGVDPWSLAAGGICAVGALFAYAQLTRTVLDDGDRPGLWHTFGIVTTSLGVNRVMPAGAAASGLVTFRLLERAGVARTRAVFAMFVQSIGSAVVLNVLLWLALLVALPTRGFPSVDIVAVAAGAVLLFATGLLTDGLVRRRRWMWATLSRVTGTASAPLPRRILLLADSASEQMAQLAHRPRTIFRATFWSTVNWLLDVGALWIFLRAFGVSVSATTVVIAFALANLAAIVPLTPGGLGVVELVMAATLVGFGAPAAPVALGIAAYRVFNYWLPIPGSVVAYGVVRLITSARAAPVPAAAPAAA